MPSLSRARLGNPEALHGTKFRRGRKTWQRVRLLYSAAEAAATTNPSYQQRTWCIWVESGATGQRGDATESVVGCNEHTNVPGLLEVKGNGQLQCIKGPKALRHSVLTQEAPGAMEMNLVNRWPN